jgi:glycosyltransferase involved in cell wall biosynthesis
MRQLLAGFPSRQIYWWSCRPASAADLPLHARQHFYYPTPSRLFPHRKFTRLKSWLLETLWAPRAAAHLRAVVAEVRPDQLWLVLHGWGIPVFARAQLSRSHRTHVSIWDYPDTRARCRVLGSRRGARMMSITEALYQEANTCDVISQPMLEDMAQRTSRSDAIVLHSGFEPWHLTSLSTSDVTSGPEIEIAYAGTIIVPEVFQFFVGALERVRAALPRPIRLTFFGGRTHNHQPWFNPEWMREEDHLEDTEFEKRIRQCTWGLTVMDLTDDDPRYNRFSFPNKFGTYLSAGLPLIVLGHRASTAAKMIRAHEVGFFSDTTDLNELSTFLQRVLTEPAPKQRFRDNILRCAAEEFDISRIRRALWDCFGVRIDTSEATGARAQHDR